MAARKEYAPGADQEVISAAQFAARVLVGVLPVSQKPTATPVCLGISLIMDFAMMLPLSTVHQIASRVLDRFVLLVL